MRKVLNVLQSAATAYNEVNEDTVYSCVGHPSKADLSNIVNWLLNFDFCSANKSKISIWHNFSCTTWYFYIYIHFWNSNVNPY